MAVGNGLMDPTHRIPIGMVASQTTGMVKIAHTCMQIQVVGMTWNAGMMHGIATPQSTTYVKNFETLRLSSPQKSHCSQFTQCRQSHTTVKQIIHWPERLY